jgi:hypothetical protein
MILNYGLNTEDHGSADVPEERCLSTLESLLLNSKFIMLLVPVEHKTFFYIEKQDGKKAPFLIHVDEGSSLSMVVSLCSRGKMSEHARVTSTKRQVYHAIGSRGTQDILTMQSA